MRVTAGLTSNTSAKAPNSLFAAIFFEHLIASNRSVTRKGFIASCTRASGTEGRSLPGSPGIPTTGRHIDALFLVPLYIAAKDLVSGMAVPVEKVKRDVIEREKMRVQQPMSPLMRDGRPDPPRGDLTALGIQSSGNDDCRHAVLSEPGEP